MIRTVYIAGNWKMHNTIAESRQLINDIASALPPALPTDRIRLLVAPPFTALAAAQAVARGTVVELAAQNVAIAESGAHTGEISCAMLSDVGVRYAIIGHSERRHIYMESDALITKRVRQAIDGGLTPILCVGELLEERHANRHIEVCRTQLMAGLATVTAEEMANIIVAYEPVWAIGTGQTATPSDADTMHSELRDIIANRYTMDIADRLSILYGGSVKPDNSTELLAREHIDGALIGGASLHAESFIAIMRSAL